jgi:hypothetical protein
LKKNVFLRRNYWFRSSVGPEKQQICDLHVFRGSSKI